MALRILLTVHHALDEDSGAPGRDSAGIVHSVHRLIADRRLLDRLRRNAHAAAQAYRWSTVAGETIAAYREFLSEAVGEEPPLRQS